MVKFGRGGIKVNKGQLVQFKIVKFEEILRLIMNNYNNINGLNLREVESRLIKDNHDNINGLNFGDEKLRLISDNPI